MIQKNFCRICAAICGLQLEVEENRIVSVKGDPENRQSGGYLCVKAGMIAETTNGHDRLFCSQERGADGRFTDVDPEEALDAIAERLEGIVAEHGPGAVGVYFGTGAQTAWYGSLIRSFLHQLGSPYLFSSMTIDQSAKWVTAGRLGVFASGLPALEDLGALLLAGNNPAVAHSGRPMTPVPSARPMTAIREARKRGMRVVVVDPRRTETADQADLHLQIIPGEDATLFAGIIRIVLENGWEDRAFCDRFVQSLDRLRQAVEDFTLDHVSERTGVPEDRIVEAARIFATARRASAYTATGPDMAAHSNLTEHLVGSLNAICGGYKRAGDLVKDNGLMFGSAPIREGVVPPTREWESGPKCRSADAGRLFGEFPTALIPREILEPESGLRALIVLGGNPALALGDPEYTSAALRSLDLLVTIDPRMNETGEMSDYVIASSLQYERHDVTATQDAFFTIPFAQYAPPAVEKPAKVMHGWEFWWGIAQRMGLQLTLKRPIFGVDFEMIPDGVDVDMTERPTAEALIEALCGLGSVSLDELKKHPSGYAPDRAPSVVEPAPDDATDRLEVCPEDIGEELVRLRAETNPSERRYRLIARRMLHTMNGAYRSATRTQRKYPTNPLFMHPEDMREEGVAAGGAMEIESEHGSVVAYVEPDDRMRRGVIALPHMWGALDAKSDPEGRRGAHVGHLISLRRDLEPINFMPLQSGISVDLRARPDLKRVR